MKQLPNILTLANLFCGSLACIFVINGNCIEGVFFLLILSLIFDFFDGFVARLVRASGAFGKELDSLADVVSFGLLPGLMMLKLLGGVFFHADIIIEMNGESFFEKFMISSLGLFITLFSAYRLAKFNLDKEQAYYFKGLPVPANTIFIFSIYWLIHERLDVFWNNQILLPVITAASCGLLVCNIPLMSLKIKKFTWKDNRLVFSFLLASITLFAIFQMQAAPFIILIYLLLSIIFKKEIVAKNNL
jgi:CDP-diacylglycerol--serine O-phosphatidyltransferase